MEWTEEQVKFFKENPHMQVLAEKFIDELDYKITVLEAICILLLISIFTGLISYHAGYEQGLKVRVTRPELVMCFIGQDWLGDLMPAEECQKYRNEYNLRHK